MSENSQLVYQSRRQCEIYRDTGVSKKVRDREWEIETERDRNNGHERYLLCLVISFFAYYPILLKLPVFQNSHNIINLHRLSFSSLSLLLFERM